MRSDGIELELADGRTVRPVVRDSETEEDWIATKVWVVDEYAEYAPEIDSDGVYLWFEEAGDE